MESLLWKVGSMVAVVGFIALIIYLNHRDTVKGKEIESNEHYYKLGNELREFYEKYPDVSKYENDPDFVGITKDELLEFCDRICCSTYHLSPEDIPD